MKSLSTGLAFAIFLGGSASAADLSSNEILPPTTDQASFEKRWEFTVVPYFWVASLDGTIGIGQLPPVDVDASFSDIIDHLDFAFMVAGEARYDRIGIVTDIMYTKVSADGTGPLGLLEASVTSEILVGTLMGEYRVVEAGRSSVDVMAGARVWGVKGDFDVKTAGEGVGLISGSDDKYWVDPMIGVKGRAQGASPFYLAGWAMIGGFGVSSDIDWDVFGGVGYEFNDRFSLLAGYRGLGVDYKSGNFLFDVIEHGPILGASFHF